MKKVILFLIAGILIPVFTHAQLSKLMSTYQGKDDVTITHLDKNLYGLYKKKNIAPEAENLLKELKEVNIITFDLTPSWDPETIINKFTQELETHKYNLVKSAQNHGNRQLIYSKNEASKLSDLVFINQGVNKRLDIIELRGNIQPENIALLSKALNVSGLNSISSLSPNNENYTNYLRSFDHDNRADLAHEMTKMAEEFRAKFNSTFSDPFTARSKDQYVNDMDSIFNSLGMNFDKMGNAFSQLESQFNKLDDNISITSNSVQITEDNGKTKIKINAKNSVLIYIVDGIKFEGEEVTMPEKLKSIRIIEDKKDPKKSYLIVTSDSQLGQFVSYKNNTLTFKYDNQEYQYKLGKTNIPILLINDQATNDFSEISPEEILQIRPITQIEKETGEYPQAEVFIITK